MKMISRRDFLKASAVVGATAAMTACGGSSSSTAASTASSAAASSTAASAAGSANIGVCIYQFADNFMTLYRTDLEEYLKDMGYSVTIMDGKNDQNTQTEQINTFLQQGVDVLVINPVQTTSAQTDAPVTENSTGEIDEAKAKEIALAHAGVPEKEADITKLKLDYEDGRQVYEIEWYANGAKYDYEVEVATGEVIKSGYEAKNSPDTGNGVTTDEETAKQTALARVSGATEKDIYEWKLDYDDNRPEYEGKIIYGDMEYEFTIDANTGEILEWDMDSVYD